MGEPYRISTAPEFAAFGVDFPSARERAEQLGEALEVLRLLFTADQPSFTGRHFSLREAPSSAASWPSSRSPDT